MGAPPARGPEALAAPEGAGSCAVAEFAFAFLDRREGALWLGRDRIGSGWGTWIRTKTGGVRVRCPTVRRSPKIRELFQ